MPKVTDNKLEPELWAEKYSEYLFNYAVHRVYNKELALDLVQDTFLSALHAKESFEGRSTEKTWLISILKRKIIDHYRKASTRKEKNLIDKNFVEGSGELPFFAEGELEGHWIPEKGPQDWNTGNNSSFDNEELSSIIQDCISKLPERWASIFTLRVIEEMETEKVCKELDITSSNLWVILHRAKLQLRECIEKNWFN